MGVSQQALAEALGLTFQQVQKYERGTNRVSASMLVKTARKLDCPVGHLVGEDEQGAATDGLLSRLSVPGSLELLDAYAAVPDERSRRAVVTLARSLRETAPGPSRR